jgi:uncharacterized protein (TIGR02265 family)
MSGSERLVFSQTVEALMVRGIGDRLTSEARARLRALGLDLDRSLLPAYPAAVWKEVLAETARSVFPELTVEEAMLEMGDSTVSGMEKTLVGRATIAMARLIGPVRMMKRLAISVKSGTNFAGLTVKELGPREFELESAPNPLSPEFMRGALLAALAIAGGKQPSVEVTAWDQLAERQVFRVSWDA